MVEKLKLRNYSEMLTLVVMLSSRIFPDHLMSGPVIGWIKNFANQYQDQYSGLEGMPGNVFKKTPCVSNQGIFQSKRE